MKRQPCPLTSQPPGFRYNNHWSKFEPLIQPILDQIAATYPHTDRNYLRVLLVKLDAGESRRGAMVVYTGSTCRVKR